MRLTVVRVMIGGLVSVLIVLQLVHLSMISWLENKATAMNNGRRSAGSGSLPSQSQHNHSRRDRTKFQPLEAKLDTTGSYKIYHSYVKSHALSGISNVREPSLLSDVTLVTQCTVNNLYHLVDLVVRWQGPASVAVFSFGPDTSTFNNVVFTLRECFPAVKENVTFHLVQPITEITETLSSATKELSYTKLPCDSILDGLKGESLRQKNYALRVPYPGNVLRNVARSGALSRFIFVVDIDMIPSENLRAQFLHLSRSSIILREETEYSKRTAFVVPAFEIQEDQSLPTDREELLAVMVRYGHVRPFYIENCLYCQNHTDYNRWQRTKSTPGAVNIAYTVEWKPLWEPFYIGHRDIPLYDERFKQYGYNRISQVCEMHVAGYNFAILDSAFLLHKGYKEKLFFHTEKLKENRQNKELFLHFQEELKVKYPDSSKRCQA